MTENEENRNFEVQVSRKVAVLLLLSYVLVFTVGFLARFQTALPGMNVGSSVLLDERDNSTLYFGQLDAEIHRPTETILDPPLDIGFGGVKSKAEEESDNNQSESLPLLPISTNSSDESTTKTIKIVCLVAPSWGRTMNKHIQLATLLHILDDASVVALKNPEFSEFFTEWFEPRDDVCVDYDEDAPCDSEYTPFNLHYLYIADKWKEIEGQFKTLIPKAAIRSEAEIALKEYSGLQSLPVATVHRRDFEGGCKDLARDGHVICPNPLTSLDLNVSNFLDFCLMDYPMILNETDGMKVVLFTDGQVARLDNTFPTISNHPFPVQAWMMTISSLHIGNPFSTVDLVVYFWRRAMSETYKDMRPSNCFKPT